MADDIPRSANAFWNLVPAFDLVEQSSRAELQ